MSKRHIIKAILGIVLIILLVFIGYRLLNIFAETIVGMISGSEIEDNSGDYQLYTPEPMPTMPAYIGEDSFYDNADDVDFGDE